MLNFPECDSVSVFLLKKTGFSLGLPQGPHPGTQQRELCGFAYDLHISLWAVHQCTGCLFTVVFQGNGRLDHICHRQSPFTEEVSVSPFPQNTPPLPACV